MAPMRVLFHALALHSPRGGWWDVHLLGALLAALPVWGGMWAVGMAGSRGMAPETLVYLAVVTPLLEEVTFRGALQGWLRDGAWGRSRVMGLTWANLLVSALFGVVHLIHHSVPWALAVVVPSLVMGHLRDRTGSVWPAVVTHGWYNAGYFLLVS